MSKTNRYLMMGVITLLIIGTIVFLGRTQNQPESKAAPTVIPTKSVMQKPTITTMESMSGSQAAKTNEKTMQASQAAATTAQNTVIIQNFAFSPKTITIKAGDTVTFTNKDSVKHTATDDSGSFDTGLLAQNESKTVKFKNKGTYTYHCTLHPKMQATVVVK